MWSLVRMQHKVTQWWHKSVAGNLFWELFLWPRTPTVHWIESYFLASFFSHFLWFSNIIYYKILSLIFCQRCICTTISLENSAVREGSLESSHHFVAVVMETKILCVLSLLSLCTILTQVSHLTRHSPLTCFHNWFEPFALSFGGLRRLVSCYLGSLTQSHDTCTKTQPTFPNHPSMYPPTHPSTRFLTDIH